MNAFLFTISLILCQDLVQVKMRFPHINLMLALHPVAIYDTILRSHLVTCNHNDCGFAWCCRKLPDIRIPSGMHAHNHGS